MNELVYIEKHDTGVAEIVLNNPARKNAMGAPMMRELCAAVLEVQDDDEVRAIVLRGEGGCFCSGAICPAWPPVAAKAWRRAATASPCSDAPSLISRIARSPSSRRSRGTPWAVAQPRSGVRYGLCRR